MALRFAPLIRVSTEKQEKQGESLRTQKSQIQQYVHHYLKGTIPDHCWGYSGPPPWVSSHGLSHPGSLQVRHQRRNPPGLDRARRIEHTQSGLTGNGRECKQIIVYEMVHLLERHHNDRFAARLDRFMPQWREVKEILTSFPLGHEIWGY